MLLCVQGGGKDASEVVPDPLRGRLDRLGPDGCGGTRQGCLVAYPYDAGLLSRWGLPGKPHLRVNSYKNVTEEGSLTHLEMLPKECHLL